MLALMHAILETSSLITHGDANLLPQTISQLANLPPGARAQDALALYQKRRCHFHHSKLCRRAIDSKSGGKAFE